MTSLATRSNAPVPFRTLVILTPLLGISVFTYMLTRAWQVMYGKSRATGQEYAIKVLDKAHLKRNNKLQTALAEKDSLVRLGAGHPGIVRLHYAFHDEWSLCASIPQRV
jgi:serine/threonine protein kinase